MRLYTREPIDPKMCMWSSKSVLKDLTVRSVTIVQMNNVTRFPPRYTYKVTFESLDEVTATIATRQWSTVSNLLLAEADVALDPGEATALALLMRSCLEVALGGLK